MTDPQFPSNSIVKKTSHNEEKPKVKQVVQTEVIRRKKPLGKRMTEMFFGGADARTVWGFVALEVILPGLRDMVADAGREAIERMIYGESGSRSRSIRRQASQSRMNYNGISSGRTDPRASRTVLSAQARNTHNFDEVVIPQRVEAEEVLDNMFELMSRFEVVTVADFYDLVGVSSSFQDSKWGWEDLRGTRLRRARNGGYILDLPRPEPLS